MKNMYTYIFENLTNQSSRIAIQHNNVKITYFELYKAMLKRITYFKYIGIGNGDIIAVYMNNSIDMIVSTLSILVLKAVVLPLDVNSPLKRIENIIKNSNPKFILCNKNSITFFENCIEAIDIEAQDEQIDNDFDYSEYNIDDVIYCIYTSGSTGIPKGILLTAGGIFNHIKAKIELLNINSESRICLSYNIGFVASIWQILTPFIIGSTLVIYDNDILKDTIRFMEEIQSDGINILSVVPHLLKVYCNFITNSKNRKMNLPDLKYIILTGEKCNVELVHNFYKHYPNITLINAYGQSECSDDTFHYIISHEFNDEIVPIGKPINNIDVFVLDDKLERITDIEKGELYIGGIALAKGYLNDSVKTKQSFILSSVSKDVLFKTGDIVKYNSNGELLYLGRSDNQVKIHGFRVELEDIENHICDFFGILQALVRPCELKTGDIILEALYTSKFEINEELLRKYLKTCLPEYMLPVKYVRVENFHYTPNGKIDRSAVINSIVQNVDLDKNNTLSLLSPIQKRAFIAIRDNLDKNVFSNINIDTDLSSVGIDSITFVSIVISLEAEFDFEWEDQMLLITAFRTIKSMVEYVESRVSE